MLQSVSSRNACPSSRTAYPSSRAAYPSSRAAYPSSRAAYPLRFLAGIGLVLGLLLAGPASARNEVVEVTVETAKGFEGREEIGPLPFFMKGQSGPAVASTVKELETHKTTNAFNKSDEHACGIAFQSAIIQLQERARELGADAVVDIVSVVSAEKPGGKKDRKEFSSPTSFQCEAGNVVANVTLKGRAVKLAE